jgi:exopolysaccharide production protein ExoQ
MKKLLLFAEKAFTVLSLIHYSGGPLVVILSDGASEGDNPPEGSSDFALIQLLFLVIYLIAFCLLVLRWKKAVKVITKDKFMWLLVGLAVFSIFWSDAPDVTKSRTIALVGTMLFSVYLATRYTLKEQLQLLGWTFGIVIVASFVFAVGLPKYGRMSGVHFSTWRGIYNHKNVLGKVMAPSAIVFLLLALQSQKRSWLFWVGMSLSVLLIITSKASSPMINLFILIPEFFLFRILRWQYKLMIPSLMGILTIGTIIYSFVATNPEAIAAFFGKDLTLTGRTNMWPFILDKIVQSPWLGYGFGAFWRGLEGPSADVWYASGWRPPNSHNGYLDLLLELGLVGLSIYLIGFLTSFQKGLAYIRSVKTSDGFWPAIFLTYIVLANLTESTLIIQNNFFFVIQAAIFFSIRIPQEQVHKSMQFNV